MSNTKNQIGATTTTAANEQELKNNFIQFLETEFYNLKKQLCESERFCKSHIPEYLKHDYTVIVENPFRDIMHQLAAKRNELLEDNKEKHRYEQHTKYCYSSIDELLTIYKPDSIAKNLYNSFDLMEEPEKSVLDCFLTVIEHLNGFAMDNGFKVFIPTCIK